MEFLNDADIAVYTDGSKIGDGVGASAVMYKKGHKTNTGLLRLYLGHANQHTSYEAEAAGLTLAGWMLRRESRRLQGKKVLIYVDNQGAILSAAKPRAKSAQYMFNEFLSLMEETKEMAGYINPPQFKIAWISSHSDVPGNERADSEAKLAAKGKSSDRGALPILFRSPLPKNAAALKQHFYERLKLKWKVRWRKSPQHNRLSRHDPQFPPSTFYKTRDKLSCREASLLTQIRTGHIPLKSYLHRIKRADTPFCEHCLEDDNMEETLYHYLFECSGFAKERAVMARHIGRGSNDFKHILSNTRNTTHLIEYVTATKRFAR